MMSLYSFLRNLIQHRRALAVLLRRELNERYVGSALGPLWSLVQPAVTVVIYWFVFSCGLKVHSDNGAPFLLTFLAGYIPWLMFSEVIGTSPTLFTSQSYLIKRTTFAAELLIAPKITAAFIPHIFLMIILAVIAWSYGYGLNFSIVLLPIYLVGLILLTSALSLFFSVLNIFARDTAPFVSSVLSLWFWITPIVWSPSVFPENYRKFLYLNPFYFIVEGYRSAFGLIPQPSLIVLSIFIVSLLLLQAISLRFLYALKHELVDFL